MNTEDNFTYKDIINNINNTNLCANSINFLIGANYIHGWDFNKLLLFLCLNFIISSKKLIESYNNYKNLIDDLDEVIFNEPSSNKLEYKKFLDSGKIENFIKSDDPTPFRFSTVANALGDNYDEIIDYDESQMSEFVDNNFSKELVYRYSLENFSQEELIDFIWKNENVVFLICQDLITDKNIMILDGEVSLSKEEIDEHIKELSIDKILEYLMFLENIESSKKTK